MEEDGINRAQEWMLVPFIIDLVRKKYDLPKGYELYGNRKFINVRAKFLSIYLIRKHTSFLTLKAIGEYYNVKHCNIIYAVKKISNDLFFDKELEQQIEELETLIEHKKLYILSSSYVDYQKMNKESDESFSIDLNSFSSISLSANKYILAVNFSNIEMDMLSGLFKSGRTRTHTNTGIKFIEKNETKTG